MIRTVTDERGIEYTLDACIGQGGQGRVFSVVENPRVAIKLVATRSIATRSALEKQLAEVGRMPLDGIPISRPLALLQSHAGYVMELLEEMKALACLIRPPNGTKSVKDWYAEGGGLRRRLRLLALAADILARLHGQGLVYGDPSPKNVFVSASTEAEAVWLIDSDNLVCRSSPAKKILFSPGYGAPEVVRLESGVNTLTDAHSFSVLAFETLTLTHPLLGDLVHEGAPELEDRALRGELPWIEDPKDESNRSSRGVPRSHVLSTRLLELFQAAFGAGLNEPKKRPGLAVWAERLHAAADFAICCASCRLSYYLNRQKCPWCEERLPSLVLVSMHLSDPEQMGANQIVKRPQGGKEAAVLVGATSVTHADPLILTRRMCFGREGMDGSAPVLRLSLEGNRLTLQSLDGQVYPFTPRSSSRPTKEAPQLIGPRERTISLKPGPLGWTIHLGSDDRLHRALHMDFRPGAVS